ncbi:hypothetical protein BGZ57DRAFT_1006367 [Hyaloscypha finlandica]|nr:hypothetical protein BGZ57DRAFT_1006367 [Hyaloscypha finlandica]
MYLGTKDTRKDPIASLLSIIIIKFDEYKGLDFLGYELKSVKEVLDYIDRSNSDPDKDIPTILKGDPIPELLEKPTSIIDNLALIIPARKALLRKGTRYSLNSVSRVITTTTTTTNPFTLGPLLALPTNKGKGKGKEIDLIGPKPSLRKGPKRIIPENISLIPQSKKPRTLTLLPIKKLTPVKKLVLKKLNPLKLLISSNYL